MNVKSVLAAATTAAVLVATPALAQDAPTDKSQQGKATAPGQLCKTMPKKKTMKGEGKSPFAACVVGVKRAQREIAEQAETPKSETAGTAPAKLCKDLAKKKATTDRKSPFAACVSGAAKAQNEQQA